MRFRFPKTPEGEAKLAEFQEAMQFGTPVSLSGDFVEHLAIDAPAGHVGALTDNNALRYHPP